MTLIAGQAVDPAAAPGAATSLRHPGRLVSTAGVLLLVLAIIEGPQWAGPRRPHWPASPRAGVLLTRVHRCGAAHRGAAARRPGLQDPPLHRRCRLDLGGVLLPLRLHLPHHPVLPVRQGLLDAVGRRAHAAVRHRGGVSRRSPPSWRCRWARGSSSRWACADGSWPRRGGIQLVGGHRLLGADHAGHGAAGPRAVVDHGADGGGSHGLGLRRPAVRRRRQQHHPGARRHARVAVFGPSSPRPTRPKIISAFRSLPIPAGPRPRRTSPWRPSWRWSAMRRRRPAGTGVDHFTAFHSGCRWRASRRRAWPCSGRWRRSELLPGRERLRCRWPTGEDGDELRPESATRVASPAFAGVDRYPSTSPT